MAVAVKNTPESPTRTALGALVPASMSGGAVHPGLRGRRLLGRAAALGARRRAIPATSVPFVSVAGLIVVEVVAIGVLAFVGDRLVGPTPPRGLRAGVFVVLAWLFVSRCWSRSWSAGYSRACLGGVPAVGHRPDGRRRPRPALLGLVADLPAQSAGQAAGVRGSGLVQRRGSSRCRASGSAGRPCSASSSWSRRHLYALSATARSTPSTMTGRFGIPFTRPIR